MGINAYTDIVNLFVRYCASPYPVAYILGGGSHYLSKSTLIPICIYINEFV